MAPAHFTDVVLSNLIHIMITLSPGATGFIKGILGVLVIAVVSYLSDASHLSGILSVGAATIVAGLFSGVESSLKAQSGNTTALFGAIKLK